MYIIFQKCGGTPSKGDVQTQDWVMFRHKIPLLGKALGYKHLNHIIYMYELQSVWI